MRLADAFLHPVFRFFEPQRGKKKKKKKGKKASCMVHVTEDFTTRWQSGVAHHGVIRSFLRRAVKRTYGDVTACGAPTSITQRTGVKLEL